MLTRALRNLEATKLITRGAATPDVCAAEYSLTHLGRTFIAPLDSMCQWVSQHEKDIRAEVHLL
jgi:DNA-binding HxlR family transcriptional regulator